MIMKVSMRFFFRRLLCIAFLGFCMLSSGCGDDDDNNATGGDADTDSDADGDADTGTIDGFALLQGQTEHTGAEVVINELTGFQGHTDSTGAYVIAKVPPGAYTVTAMAVGYADQTSSPISVVSGETTTVPPLTLSNALGDLEGYVQLQGQNDHSGTAVSIQDTSYAAETDEDGFWSFEEIETGQYRIDATHESYFPSEATDITVVAGQVTTVPPITLTEAIWQGDYTITNQSELDALHGYTAVIGVLFIENSNITNVDGLESLTSVRGLSVQDNGELQNLNGLSGLTVAEEGGRSLEINNNPSLNTLVGLNNVTSVSYLHINDNDSLQNLDGLNALSEVQEWWITSNDSLQSLDGLDKLSVILDQLAIEYNISLTNIDSFFNAASIGGEFFVVGNVLLPTCQAIELKEEYSLPSKGGNLCIKENKHDSCPDDCPES